MLYSVEHYRNYKDERGYINVTLYYRKYRRLAIICYKPLKNNEGKGNILSDLKKVQLRLYMKNNF